ncbi:mucin-4 [Schistocerca piceifrons]|uniref:mucin-4 n=1 Tax=Schistocerca piceifrons TaxID=274613 RepID=UPI001F5F622F|nr:mucin-4 [Schistocerca piceifrons]XP_047102272.1 mucin-4 [Schistocerca piceifrons]
MKTLLFILATCLVAICDSQRRPPSYSLDDMPETSFDCRDKILGGYYADPETDCQMFHVCVKVPGVGVQNYRFLCPNDTAFDQESQICASWYDVDCEAALLYADNFDLYRIGYVPSSPAIVASKATALPLGPSTAAPARPRQPFNSRQPQLDDEYYLQAGDTGDRRLQPKDVLRGSSSGNFFNQKKGREEEEEAVISKKKVAVRKFRKRPSQQPEDNGQAASTAAPTTYYSTAGATSSRSTSGNTYLPRYNTIQRTSQTPVPVEAVSQTRRTTFQQRPSTAAPATASSAASNYPEQSRDNYNTVADNYNYQSRQQQNNYNYASSTAAPRTNNYNYQAETRPNYNAASPTSSTPLDKYSYQTVQRNGNSFPTTTIAPSRSNTYYNNENVKGNSDFAGTTAAPLSETTFYQQRNRNVQRYDTFAPVTTYAPNAYSTRNSSPNTEYDSSGNTVPQRFNTGRDSARVSVGSTSAVTSAPLEAETYQRNNNFNQRGSANSFSTTTAKPAYTYYDEYETRSTGSSEEYNNYNPNNYDYQRTNYNAALPGTFTGNDRTNGESLRAAPSNNYGPSSFNSFPNGNSGKPVAGSSTGNDQSQYNYNSGNGNSEQYNNRESTFFTTKQENYNAVNASVQQSARSNYYSSDVTSRPSTNQQVPAFSVRQLPRTTDDESSSYDTSNNYRTTSRPRSSYNTNEVASTSVTSNTRSSFYTQTTVANTVTTQRPQYTQAAVQKQYTDAARNQSPTFKGGKAPTVVNNTASAANKTVPKTGDIAYDYAYYDETAPSEYEGLDPISDRHFGKNAESLKVARRATK